MPFVSEKTESLDVPVEELTGLLLLVSYDWMRWFTRCEPVQPSGVARRQEWREPLAAGGLSSMNSWLLVQLEGQPLEQQRRSLGAVASVPCDVGLPDWR